MDESEEATDESKWWSPIEARLRNWNWPQTHRIAQTSVVALRILGWRERAQRFWSMSMATVGRVRETYKLAYAVIPAPLLRGKKDGAARREVAPRVRIICNP